MNDASTENREALREALTLDGTKWQHLHGVADPASVAPKAYYLDAALMRRPGNEDIQLDLFLDYANNPILHPVFQNFFRTTQVPTLVIWGKNDPFFILPGAEASRRDNSNAEVHLLETGHFALETHVDVIAAAILRLLARAVH